MTYGAIGVASILSAGLVGCKDDDDVNCDGVDFIGRFDNSDCAECLESDTFGNCKGNIPTIAEACDGIAYEADYEIDINNKCGVCLSYQFVANPQMVQGEAWSACGGTAAPCDGLNIGKFVPDATDGCKTCFGTGTPSTDTQADVQKFVNTCGGSIDFGSDICKAQTYSEYDYWYNYDADSIPDPLTECNQCYQVFGDDNFWGVPKSDADVDYAAVTYVDRCKGKTESATSCDSVDHPVTAESEEACYSCVLHRTLTNMQQQEIPAQAYLSCGGEDANVPCLNSPSYEDIDGQDLSNLPEGACKTCVAAGTGAADYFGCGGTVPCFTVTSMPTQGGMCQQCINGLPSSVTGDAAKLAACGGS